MLNAPLFENQQEFVNKIIGYFEYQGYQTFMPEEDVTHYDLKLVKDNSVIAVQIKNYKIKVNVAVLNKFIDYLDSDSGKDFTDGWIISSTGFGKPAMTLVAEELPQNIRLGTYQDDRVAWEYPDDLRDTEIITPSIKETPKKEKIKYIGVFTCKGGVGKTTVSAHLGGAFALMGYDVILLDLDPDRNLRKLFLNKQNNEEDMNDDEEDASIYVPGRNGEAGATITVLYHEEWDEKNYPDVKLVVCDCSPVLNQNPQHLIEKLDYCIIPTTLNPLGVSKNGDVIIRTFEHIREVNKNAEMFALINGYDAGQASHHRNEILFNYLSDSLSHYLEKDPKCKLINPEAAKVRHSRSLQFWGLHIVEDKPPALAFKDVGGKSNPRADFLQLAEYIQNSTDIDQLLAAEKR